MSTIPIHFQEVIRFYARVNKLRNNASGDQGRSSSPDLLNISSEAKKKLVLEQARNEVLEKIKK
ncbi:MAG: hypothetical protein HY879_00790 [Deltaproteobacteria bacterium]|nr:hypothetical protein [Deltaproteobacteria bacterium]